MESDVETKSVVDGWLLVLVELAILNLDVRANAFSASKTWQNRVPLHWTHSPS